MEKVGLITVDDSRASRVTAVLIDGVDVTAAKVCAADDRHGWAVLVARDADGRCFLRPDTRFIQMEIRTGRVNIVFASDEEPNHAR